MPDPADQQTEMPDAQSVEAVTRAPRNLLETVLANCRPQPAIPAVLVFLLTIMLTLMLREPGVEAGLMAFLIPIGILVSCSLAVAAGFCSFFPPAVWILLAGWSLGYVESGVLPAYNRYVIFAGALGAVVMLLAQLWRVSTGRFVPTLRVTRSQE